MAAGYNVGIGSDTNAFRKGIESGVIDPLEDAQKELEALGKSKGPDQLERGLKDAQDATERLKKETKETADAIDSEYRQSFRKVKAASDEGMNGAKEGMQDFKQEANQTARESAASFDGSAESIVDMFQETAANAFAGFGPAGAVAGLAAAAGIGLIVSAMEGGTEQSEAFREKVGEITAELIEAGEVGVLSIDYLIDRLKDLATETDPAKDSLADLRRQAELAGVPFDKLAEAYAGNADALDDYIKGVKDEIQAHKDAITTGNALEGAIVGVNTAEDQRYDALQKTVEGYEATKTAVQQAAEEEAAYIAAGGPEMEIKRDLVEGIASAYDTARDSTSDFIDENNNFDISGWMAYVEEHKGLVETFKANLEQMKLSPDQWANFLELPESAQQAIAGSWSTGDSALRSQIASTLTDGAGSAGTDAAVAFDDAFKPTAEVDVQVKTDAKPAETAIAAVADAKYTATIDVKSTGKAATKAAIDAVAKARTATVAVDVSTASAERALSNFVNRTRTTTIVAKVVDRNGKAVI